MIGIDNLIYRKRVLKTIAVVGIVQFLLPAVAHATGVEGSGAGILGIENTWAQVKPYFIWAFTLGGTAYSCLNLRKVVLGDYRAIGPAALATIVAGLGIEGVLGCKDDFFEGNVFVLKNKSSQDLTLDESSFYKKGVVAVALKKKHLKPEESTKLFICQKRGL
ncbi:MAG: hypothetical protein HEEMFOPI_01656 [Holosporales bacterium]